MLSQNDQSMYIVYRQNSMFGSMYIVQEHTGVYIHTNSQNLERGKKSASKKRGGKNQPVKQGFIMDFCDLYYSLMILADKYALVCR